jgi:peptidylprolyl isomerase
MKVLLVLAIAAGVIAAACGGDDKSTTASPTTKATVASSGVKPGASATGQSTVPAAGPTAPAAALSDGNAPGIPELKGEIKSDGALRYIDEVVGTGASPASGQHVIVHYTGWLTTGKQFDSSRTRNQPFDFVIGKATVIKGWDVGVATMKVGGKRRLIIPPELGYGARGAGASIPANATLIFDVELLDVKP